MKRGVWFLLAFDRRSPLFFYQNPDLAGLRIHFCKFTYAQYYICERQKVLRKMRKTIYAANVAKDAKDEWPLLCSRRSYYLRSPAEWDKTVRGFWPPSLSITALSNDLWRGLGWGL